jgi:outer membrane protein
MQPFKSAATWIVYGLLAVPLYAQLETPAGSTNVISLDECIRLALEHNLDLQISRIDPRLRRFDLEGSYALYEPVFNSTYTHSSTTQEGSFSGGQLFVPTVQDADVVSSGLQGELPTGLTYDIGFDVSHRQNTSGSITNVTMRDDYDTSVGINLRQPLLKDFWTSANRAQIKINRYSLKISEYTLLYNIMSVVRDVHLAYFDLIAAQDGVKVQEKALELAERLYQENKKRVEAGTMAPLDEKQAQSEAAVARADLIAAQRLVVLRENALKDLITDNYQKWNPIRLQPTEKLIALPETYNRSESWVNALTKRPDFNEAKLNLERQGVEVRLRFNQLFPGLDIIGGYGRSGFDTAGFSGSFRDIREENNPKWSIGAIFSVPLGNRLERSRYKSARELSKQLELRLERVHQTILVGVDDAITLAQSDFQQIQARRDARLYAEAALDAEQKKYQSGKSTSFFVLQFQRDLTQARAAEIQALSDYNKALAGWYFSEGTILERDKINVEFK